MSVSARISGELDRGVAARDRRDLAVEAIGLQPAAVDDPSYLGFRGVASLGVELVFLVGRSP